MPDEKTVDHVGLDAEARAALSKWDCPEWLDPDSKGPFKDGDARYDRLLDEAQVYYRGAWWERGSFLMGRVSAMEEEAELLRHAAEKARAFAPRVRIR